MSGLRHDRDPAPDRGETEALTGECVERYGAAGAIPAVSGSAFVAMVHGII
jgi:hypothetical protein